MGVENYPPGTKQMAHSRGTHPHEERTLTNELTMPQKLALDKPSPQRSQHCRACGAAGSPPRIKPDPAAGAVLTIGSLQGRFCLLCDDCRQRIALEAAARRPRPGRA